MENKNFGKVKIEGNEAIKIASEYFNVDGEIYPLPGELDFNFKIKGERGHFILKISRPNPNLNFSDFQNKLLEYIFNSNPEIEFPKVYPGLDGNLNQEICIGDTKRIVRLLSWLDGRLWSSVNPISNDLLFSLGEQAGLITKSLKGFEHPASKRNFDWDIAQGRWTENHLGLFDEEQRLIITYFQDEFKLIEEKYKILRKSVVHNDVNDNNIIVSRDLLKPRVKAIIDFGDAIFTQSINDLAIAIAYAVMDMPDPLNAAIPIIKGYHKSFNILEEELELLYQLIGMRLVISVTKSVINKEKEPENTYLHISEKPAWDLLRKWKFINTDFAYFCFRSAAGYTPNPKENQFKAYFLKNKFSLKKMFSSLNVIGVHQIDLGVSSTWVGNEETYNNNDLFGFKMDQLQKRNKHKLLAGGYGEIRPFYCTDAYKKEGNNGPEYRSVHLGVDFWVTELTPFYSEFEGTVYSVFNNDNYKDYGPTIILNHELSNGLTFFSLYGHLSKSSLKLHKVGDKISKGDLIGYVGSDKENGSWVPHLHFQFILNMMGNFHDFPGVSYPNELNIWKSICPDPGLVFKELEFIETPIEKTDLLIKRKRYLGKSLSLSYKNPLEIVRGQGVYLVDNKGRKYLDTVNNVAHVGHEHPKVVKAGIEQMALLNTNTRYLHKNIINFAEDLLSTFPKELSVVHFVNSGSEANELALRMAKNYTRQQDIVAMEYGYHGNTGGCVDISSYKFNSRGGDGQPKHTHIIPLPDTYRGIYSGDHAGEKYAANIMEVVKKLKSLGRKPAAFICESIISCGGQIELPNGFLKLAYEYIRKEGGLCIADEVQVGCGRVGSKFWGFQLHNVIPDIVTIGKPIGNGHPLAAVVCTEKAAEAFANGMEYFNTFGGNPVSCAIGQAVLRIIKEEELQKNALELEVYLKCELEKLKQDTPKIGHVRGKGLFLGLEIIEKDKQPSERKANYLSNRMKDLGILMSTDGKDNNVLKIKPPMVFSKENASELIFRLKQVFNEDFMKA